LEEITVKNQTIVSTRASYALRFTRTVLVSAMVSLATLPGQLHAQSSARGFVPFQKFTDATQSAASSDFIGRPGSQVSDAAAFEEMRQHILTMYQGVSVRHTFFQDGHHFDCVAIEQQPSVRLQGLDKIAQAPPLSAIARNTQSADPANKAINVTSQLDGAHQADQFGNAMRCEAGTIPMRRITLDDVTRFGTLRQFFEKSSDASKNGVPRGGVSPTATDHKYSYT